MIKKTRANKPISKNEHVPGCTCSICGHNYKGISFKRGYICETCLEYIKDSCTPGNTSIK